ncbi:MAG: CsbD family protein [Burkholderiales bacterium]
MNWDIIEGNWMQFKGTVQQKWGKLTNDRLDVIAGDRVRLAGQLQEAYGITEEQAEVQVKAFEEAHKDYDPAPTA